MSVDYASINAAKRVLKQLVVKMLDDRIFEARVLKDRLKRPHDATYPITSDLPAATYWERQRDRKDWQRQVAKDQGRLAEIKRQMTLLHVLLAAANQKVHPSFNPGPTNMMAAQWQDQWLNQYRWTLDADYSWWTQSIKVLAPSEMWRRLKFSIVHDGLTLIPDPDARAAAALLGGPRATRS